MGGRGEKWYLGTWGLWVGFGWGDTVCRGKFLEFQHIQIWLGYGSMECLISKGSHVTTTHSCANVDQRDA